MSDSQSRVAITLRNEPLPGLAGGPPGPPEGDGDVTLRSRGGPPGPPTEDVTLRARGGPPGPPTEDVAGLRAGTPSGVKIHLRE